MTKEECITLLTTLKNELTVRAEERRSTRPYGGEYDNGVASGYEYSVDAIEELISEIFDK